MRAAEFAAQHFKMFVRHHDPSEGDRRDTGGYLQGYLYDWLVHGRGLAAVGGKFAIFMQTFALLAQELFEDPSFLNLHYLDETEGPKVVERRALGIFDAEGFGAACFEKDSFEVLAANFLPGQVPETDALLLAP